MELRHLRYFVAVAEELNFSRAAERVYLSQPALSQQIRKLEEELEVTLFRRTKRQVALTENGWILLEGVCRALVQIDQTVRTVRERGGVASSALKMGFPEYVNHTIVADILQTFRKRCPEVRVEEHETFSLQQTFQYLDELRHGALDVCFLLQPIQDEALMTEKVLRIELVVVLPEGHRLAARAKVPMWELANERIVLFPRHFHAGCYDYIVGCCREAGFVPNVVPSHEPQLYSGATTYRTVASGTEISLVVPPLVSTPRPAGVIFRPLQDPTPALELVAAWRHSDPSPKLRAFLEVVREFGSATIRADNSRGKPQRRP